MTIQLPEDDIRKIISLMRAVKDGSMLPEVALEKWPEIPPGDKFLDDAWHHMAHFANDTDIRHKDDYRAEMDLILEQYIGLVGLRID